MRPALCIALGLSWATVLPAQQPSLAGPVEAYTFDAPTRSLRAVIGFPGAASFGPVLRDGLDFASIATYQNYGLGFQGGQCLLISGLGSSLASTRVVNGVTAQPEGIAWSGDGSLAILYSRTGNWLQTISGFPGAPSAGPRIDGASLGGSLTAVAADAHGKLIAAGVSGQLSAVLQSSDGQTFTKVGSVQDPIALTFAGDGLTLYVLDGSTPQVVALSLSGGVQNIPLQGLANPVAVQALTDSQNRQLLYVAAASDRMLRILDAATGQLVNNVALSFEPTGLAQFGSNSFVAAARSEAAKPLWLFVAAPQPAAYFVPAVQLRPRDHRVVSVRSAR